MNVCTKFMILGCVALAAELATPGSGAAQALSRPDGWRTQAERFVTMRPGFHITTTPSVLLYHPDARAQGTFGVESEGFLFVGDSPHTYGVFVGGRHLEADDAAWTSFEIGHEGNWVVRTRGNRGEAGAAAVAEVAGPEEGPVVLPSSEDPTGKNVLRIDVDESDVRFTLNGETVLTLPRGELALDGVTGFRVGTDLNIHLTTLDVVSGSKTTHWAPAAESGAGGGAGS